VQRVRSPPLEKGRSASEASRVGIKIVRPLFDPLPNAPLFKGRERTAAVAASTKLHHALVVRFRSSSALAALSDTNLPHGVRELRVRGTRASCDNAGDCASLRRSRPVRYRQSAAMRSSASLMIVSERLLISIKRAR
jgi:hypothetical protein